MIAFAVITAVSYSPISESFSSADEVYYKQYMLKFEGEYTSEKQKMINEEDQKFADAQMKMSEEMANSEGDGVFIMMKYQDILAPQYAFEQVKAHAEYLSTTENGEFVYDSGYKLLTGDESAGNKDLTLGLTAMAMVILCLTYVYAAEYQTGANVLGEGQRRHVPAKVCDRTNYCHDNLCPDLFSVFLQRAERIRNTWNRRSYMFT